MAIALSLSAIVLLAIGAALCLNGFSASRNERIEARVDAVTRAMATNPPEADAILPKSELAAPFAGIQRMILLANLEMERRKLVALVLLLVTITALIALFVGTDYASVTALGILTITILYIRARATRNRRRFIEHLPGLIDRLQQFLASGNSLTVSFEKALRNSHPIVQTFLGQVLSRILHGATLSEALALRGHKLGISEVTTVAIIVHMNMRFGGSLQEILSHVATVLNDQLRVQGEFSAMTAEIRSSAKVLAALPVIVVGLLLIINPGHLSFFIDNEFGRQLIAGAGSFAILGGIILNAMSRIEA